MITFNEINTDRIDLIARNNDKDHVVILGNTHVLLSAPHGVNQVRLGKPKFKEVGSLAIAIYLQKATNSYLIAKTKNNYDDANFDEVSDYKNDLAKCIKENDIKYVIDFHGLSDKREMDINFGTCLGQNISADKKAFKEIHNALVKNGFSVTIDQPFMAYGNTISRFAKKTKKDVFSLQIEINCKITNKRENFEKYQKLLKILVNWIKNLGENQK